jgi:activator of Hsp90 ATPase-like protein
MTIAIKPAPVRKTVHVKVEAPRAFEVFTSRMHAWWPLDHSLLGGKPRQDVVVEPHQGGRWYERAVDGSECTWGYVIAWEPPARVLLAWQLDGQWKFNPDFVTEVEIRFIAEGAAATRVELEHRNLERYGEAAEAVRAALDSADGWSTGLGRFAALANAEG